MVEFSIVYTQDGNVKIKFFVPEELTGDTRTEFLGQVAGAIVKIFHEGLLPGIVDSFSKSSPESATVAKLIDAYMHFKKANLAQKVNMDAPLISPLAMFQGE